ncbi:hypothetical protein BsIDN1_55480 [Bacillus safensis]|uniref:Alcohol dehydrogenase iron-type/glycerol dehydrogenase GldA domain-containing protein n=1 Tax=Bacillus safensis TaxID=561879 RepID=A0A5S9MEJ4_BACIA|nr:hypothetical protein BsIDN1_55480 [Bacillus safensis]
MDRFTYWNPTKLIFGKGEVSALSDELKHYGKNVLLVYGGGSIKRNGLYDQVVSILKESGAAITELAGVEPNPRLTTVRKKGSNFAKRTTLILFWQLAAAVSLMRRKQSQLVRSTMEMLGIS